MKKVPYKVRQYVGVGLCLFAVIAVIVTILIASYGAPIWMLITIPIVAALCFVVGIIFVPTTNEDGTPIVIKKKQKKIKPIRYEIKKQKRSFMTEEERNEQEEEDDEMMFIEEEVEDH